MTGLHEDRDVLFKNCLNAFCQCKGYLMQLSFHLKSGIPHTVEIPAPVKTITDLLALICKASYNFEQAIRGIVD